MNEIPYGYCRYCSWAAYQGDDYAVCTSDTNRGLAVKKTSKRKSCKNFDANSFDVFSPDFGNNLREYKPRVKKRVDDETAQMNIFDFIG